MCHRYTPLSHEETQRVTAFLGRVAQLMREGAAADAEAARLRLPPGGIALSRIDCYPGKPCEAIARDGDALVERELTWGFKAQGRDGLVFNARLESALSGMPMWREAMSERRCIVPAHAFYETRKGTRSQVRFSARAADALLLAGLYEGERFALVTTEPNDPVRAVHDRMPLVLSAQEAIIWLTGSIEDARRLADRSSVELDAMEEPPICKPNDDSQLSLF